jgi:hypothetical protein
MKKARPNFHEYNLKASRSDNMAKAEVFFFFFCPVKRTDVYSP